MVEASLLTKGQNWMKSEAELLRAEISNLLSNLNSQDEQGHERPEGHEGHRDRRVEHRTAPPTTVEEAHRGWKEVRMSVEEDEVS